MGNPIVPDVRCISIECPKYAYQPGKTQAFAGVVQAEMSQQASDIVALETNDRVGDVPLDTMQIITEQELVKAYICAPGPIIEAIFTDPEPEDHEPVWVSNALLF